MLKRLRFQLTILYLLTCIGLVALIGAGTYFLLQRHLQVAADQALQYKMALQFDQYGLPLPPELAQAEQAWLKENSHNSSGSLMPSTLPSSTPVVDVPTAAASSTPAASPTLFPTQTSTSTVLPADSKSNVLQLILVSYSAHKGEGEGDRSVKHNSGSSQDPNTPSVKVSSDKGEEDGYRSIKHNSDSSQDPKTPTVRPSSDKSEEDGYGSVKNNTASSEEQNTPSVKATPDKAEGEGEGSGKPNSDSSQVQNIPSVSASSTSTPTLEAVAGLPSNNSPRPSRGEIDDDALDARLAPIFVTPLNDKGVVEAAVPAVQRPSPVTPPVLFDSQAAAAALLSGVDWRTILLSNGSRLRLLTYRTSSQSGPALLQAGRLLDDQDQLLKSFLTGILVLSGFSILLLGLASWWLSGRSLGPAEKAWEQQQAFISNASHELRTPLTLIQATTEVALRGQPTSEQKEYLSNILEEIHYMNHMVDDLLLLARKDARRLKLKREAVTLSSLFLEVKRQINNLAAEKQVALILGKSVDQVWADAARLRQVLFILLDNAIRYTPPGGRINLEAVRHGRLVKIIVSDNGPGIPAERLPHIFERFYQTSRSGEDETRSNGLGLSIAKALVEAMNGKISIESQPGEGTRVIVELPSV